MHLHHERKASELEATRTDSSFAVRPVPGHARERSKAASPTYFSDPDITRFLGKASRTSNDRRTNNYQSCSSSPFATAAGYASTSSQTQAGEVPSVFGIPVSGRWSGLRGRCLAVAQVR
jgi:hypothetical protein